MHNSIILIVNQIMQFSYERPIMRKCKVVLKKVVKSDQVKSDNPNTDSVETVMWRIKPLIHRLTSVREIAQKWVLLPELLIHQFQLFQQPA